MARRSSEDEYAALGEEEKLLLADIYPELKQKLERSIERSRKKRAAPRKAQPIPVFDISSDDDDNVKKEVFDDDEVQILEDEVAVEERSRRSEEYSFHSAKSRVERDYASMSSDSISPPTSFRAEEQTGDEMDGSFVVNPRPFSRSSFEDEEFDEQEPEGESLTEADDRSRGDEEEESVHSSDEEFIDDDEDPEMSIDQSFHADVVMETPPNKRVLPSRSTRNQQLFTNSGHVIVSAAAVKRAENPAAISPCMAVERRVEESDDDGSGEESFERYLRKLREEDDRKKREKEQAMEEEEEEEEEMEDSFVVSDDSVAVIDDEYENGSREEEEGEWRESVHSSDDEFIDDDEDPELSIDQSFQADVVMETPPNKRVLPSRSTRNKQLFTNSDQGIVPAAVKRAENPAAISPSMAVERRVEESDDDGSGEESFKRYLRKLREEDDRKKREKEQAKEEEEEEEEEMEDSFVVSDDSVDVIDDEYENGSGEEEEEGEWRDSGDSSGDDKENRRTKKIKEEKAVKKRNLLLDLADTFNSPSVRAVDKDSRDPDRHFLLSLSENYEGKRRHADAESFLKRGVRGEKTRAALVQRLFELYNREIFEEKLPSDLEITFNARLRKTAGYCKWSNRSGKCTIELSPKVCSQPDRIRDTLAHEMCHAAVFIVNRQMKEGHGPVWQSWTRAFSRRFSGFPVPSRCHSYEIEAKFVYECDGCGQLIKRHSKSLDTERKCCGRCHGRFHLREKTDANGKKRGPNGFALFVKDNYGEEKRSGRSHKEIMQLLSARFKQSKTVDVVEENEEGCEETRPGHECDEHP